MLTDPPWRPTTRAGIRSFYTDEFSDRTGATPDWVTPPKPAEFAVALSTRFPTTAGGRRESLRYSRPISPPTPQPNSAQSYSQGLI